MFDSPRTAVRLLFTKSYAIELFNRYSSRDSTLADLALVPPADTMEKGLQPSAAPPTPKNIIDEDDNHHHYGNVGVIRIYLLWL